MLFHFQDMQRYQPDEWPTSTSSWLRPVPWGLRGLLNWVKNEYNNPDIFITENGVSTALDSGTEDEERVTFYRAYINEVLKGNYYHHLRHPPTPPYPSPLKEENISKKVATC